MSKQPLSMITGGILLFVFAAILFAFQVRQTEVALVTTFGRHSESSTKAEPGLYFRLPWPIQKVYKFDNRIQNFERKFEQIMTSDANTLLITIYIGWKIADPHLFLQRFDGDENRAKQILENLVRDAKNSVVGRHPFSDLISPQKEQLKFDEMEGEMLAAIRPKAREIYGIEVSLVGIKQLGLPESITGKVFERMRAERQRQVKRYQGEGEAKAIEIRAQADLERQKILEDARAAATVMMGQADAEAAKYYRVFEQFPELAIFLQQVKALKAATGDKTTLILGPDTQPFNLLRGLESDERSAEVNSTNKPKEEERQVADTISSPAAAVEEKKIVLPPSPPIFGK